MADRCNLFDVRDKMVYVSDNCVNTHITKTEYISEEQRVSNIVLFYLSDIN